VIHAAPQHAGAMDISQLALLLAAVVGVLVVGLAAVVPVVLELPGHAR